MKKLKARLCISRPRGNIDQPFIRIEFTDDLSRCVMLEAQVDLAGFAEALCGQGYVPCEVEFNDSGRIGMTREHKTETVPWPKGKSAQEALAPFEVDGWQGRESDMHNHHRVVSATAEGRSVEVVFERWVPAKPEEAKS